MRKLSGATSVKTFLAQFFTWWNGQTLGTRFHTWRRGKRVGEDEFGNVYYHDPSTGRRWVIYHGEAEASRIPPGWYGWMHHRTDVVPGSAADLYQTRAWELPHKPNLTGTAQAYRPRGSILTPEKRPEVSGDYEPWTP